ncbi:tyrosine-type recombinase/integrase, partial [Fulvivirga imtechensis]|uniref:tyrosine-type recombinase/integrase n=1 Tax=Fulvivirga imtechensis TaxID=881893 RepID=UPI0012F8F67C
FHDPLSKEELENLYQQYEGKDKVILGLLVHQGLKTGEMEKLRKTDADLRRAQLQVPSTKGGCSRALPLAAEQIILLAARLQEHPGELLLGEKLQNRVRSIIKKIRKLNPKVRTAKHLRGSLIVYWIKSYNLRKAQYLAGHKNILSTELYQQADVEDLKKALDQFHPLK